MRPYRPVEVILVLREFGYVHGRTKGDHAILTKRGARSIPISLSRRELDVDMIFRILREARVSARDFEEAARRVL